MEKPVTFKSADQQVVGLLHLPEKRRGQVPVVLFLHGFTGNKAEFRRVFVRMARALAGIGIASLRIDFRGSGDSEGEFSAMTPSGELQDAREALRFLRRLPAIAPRRVAVLGMSLGGMIAAHVLGEDRALRTAVLWNPVSRPFDRIRGKLTPSDQKQLKEMGCLDMNGWALGQAFIQDMRRMNPLKAIAGACCPTLLIQASRDQAVLPECAAEYQKAFRKTGRELQVHLVEGAGHCFESLRWEMELIGVTLSWFQARLGA